MQLYITTICFLILTGGVSAKNGSPENCRKLSAAVTGLNYHRSDADALTSGQIWRFVAGGRLAVFQAGGTPSAERSLGEFSWAIETEDDRCVFKITAISGSQKTLTLRITDTTWAIVKVRTTEKHIPDFEDHTGMKTRYCGSGDTCERLWR